MQDAIRLYRTGCCQPRLIGARNARRGLPSLASTIAIFAAVTYATDIHADNHVTDSGADASSIRSTSAFCSSTVRSRPSSLLRVCWPWRPNRLPHTCWKRPWGRLRPVRAVFVALTHTPPSPIDPQKPRTVLQLYLLRQPSVLFRLHRFAVPLSTCLL